MPLDDLITEIIDLFWPAAKLGADMTDLFHDRDVPMNVCSLALVMVLRST